MIIWVNLIIYHYKRRSCKKKKVEVVYSPDVFIMLGDMRKTKRQNVLVNISTLTVNQFVNKMQAENIRVCLNKRYFLLHYYNYFFPMHEDWQCPPPFQGYLS